LSEKEKTNEEAESAIEKLKIELSFKGDNQAEVNEQEVLSPSEAVCSVKIKPRAVIFKAQNKDLDKIIELIETQFPEVQIIYVTTGSASSILRVTKTNL
jgi:hypothetical protein